MSIESCYNKCLKTFFGYKRSDFVTKMFDLGISSFRTVIWNCRVVFFHTCGHQPLITLSSQFCAISVAHCELMLVCVCVFHCVLLCHFILPFICFFLFLWAMLPDL